MKQQVVNQIKRLTNLEQIELVTRGNKAINAAVSIVEGKILIPEEGGWLHYKKVGNEEVKCNDAVIDLEDLKEKSKECAAFLYQSPGGYFAEQPTKEIYEICKKNGCLVIVDISGRLENVPADIVVCSFGRWKPVNAEVGGFVATNNKELFSKMRFDLLEKDFGKILKKLETLPQRLEFLKNLKEKVINDLKEFTTIADLVVIIKFSKDSEKEKIINYCNQNNLSYKECPRYIRINQNAISIEIKREEEK